MTPDTHHTAHPLTWPPGRKRTEPHRRERSKFKPASFATARDALLHELRLMGAQRVVLSTNVALRRDGLPLAGQRQPDDPGVAVFFTDRKGRPLAFACDRWAKVEDNLVGVQKTIEALRGIARWGAGDAVDAAFGGFECLPGPPPPPPWWEVLGTTEHAPTERVTECYRRVLMNAHPDRGGSDEATNRVQAAWAAFKKERERP